MLILNESQAVQMNHFLLQCSRHGLIIISHTVGQRAAPPNELLLAQSL